MGETRDLGAAGVNSERRPVHVFQAGAIGKMPDARGFLTVVGSEGEQELVAVATCAVSHTLGRLPVPIINVGGLGSVVEADRHWRLTSVAHGYLVKYILVPLAMLGLDSREVPCHRRGVNYQCRKCRVDANLDLVTVRGASRRGGRGRD